MNKNIVSRPSRVLAAIGLFSALAAAHAAGGFNVKPGDETLIKPGMSTEEVTQALGRPTRDVKFGNEPGPTFEYRVLGQQDMIFDVDFGADGRVASATERMDEIGASGHGHGGR